MRTESAKLFGPEARADETSSTTEPDEGATMTTPAPRPLEAPSSRVFPVAGWDRYEKIEFLGAGGMGKVFKAEDPRLGRPVALKLLRDSEPELVRKLLREARAQARIEHEHICKVFEAGEVGGHPYIAMQYIKGRSLKELKRELTLEQKVSALRDVAEALHAAHRAGLIHRDIKPANIMVEEGEDGRIHPYVMDFGIAREVDRAGQTMSGLVEGTPSYMAPEQARGEVHKLDRRTDVYSLGATLYDLLAGRPPFIGEASVDVLVSLALEEATPLRKLDPGIPVDLETIVMKCLEKEPVSRYESAKALADDLGRYLAGEPIGARPATLWYLLAKKARKHKVAVGMGAAAVVVALGLGGAWLDARLAARDQARLAQRLGQDVKEMELFLRYAYALPLHDAGREKAVIRARMSRLAAQAAELRGLGEGPMHYALGRGHLALHEPKEAIEQLEKAISAGYRTPEVELAMGLAMGDLYKRALDEAQRIPDVKLREARRKEVEALHLAPALKHLSASAAAESESPRYIEALIAFYSKEREAALVKAREAFAESPWLYEAKKLEGDILKANGDERSERGDHEVALEAYREAASAMKAASDIARSDAAVHEAEADVWLQMIDVYRLRAVDPSSAVANALAALDKVLASDPTTKAVHTRRGLAYLRAAFQKYSTGADSSAMFNDAEEAAKRAIAVDPGDALAHDIIGNVYNFMAQVGARTGQDPLMLLERSVSSYREAIRANPSFAWAWNDLAVAHVFMAEYLNARGLDPRSSITEAIANYERAIELNPAYSIPHGNQCDAVSLQASYELDHGIDPTSSVSTGLTKCEGALKLNPSNASVFDTIAILNTVRARHAILLGGDPSAHLARAKDAAVQGTKLAPARVELHRNLVTTYWLKALHGLEKRAELPIDLRDAITALGRLVELAPKEASTHMLKGRLELVAARSAVAHAQKPDAHFANARAAIDEALRLNPNDAEIYLTAAALCRWEAEHQTGIAKPKAMTLVDEGLARIEKSLSINPSMPQAIATKGALHLLRAHIAPSSADRAEAARLAEAALTEALNKNPFLKREYGPLLDEAQAIAKRAGAEAP
ncbi:MAG TPA: protein kinase [Polyangiaceae bacterium]|nr:protein kinase [Polyangiaceae bacterium]